jgi:hypothetical protein
MKKKQVRQSNEKVSNEWKIETSKMLGFLHFLTAYFKPPIMRDTSSSISLFHRFASLIF